jgi:hypothetical protein
MATLAFVLVFVVWIFVAATSCMAFEVPGMKSQLNAATACQQRFKAAGGTPISGLKDVLSGELESFWLLR